MPATTSTSHTGNAYIDGVLYGTQWATTNLTYSFPTSASYYGSSYGSGEPQDNFEAFNSTQQAAARTALGMYSAVANLTFTEVTETSSTHADIRYAMSDTPGTAWAYMPTTLAEGGDAWFNNSSGWYDNPVDGNYAFVSIVHETGHTMGLKHPHETSGSFAAMPADHDSLEYSVMSYRSYVGASTSTGYTNAPDSYPQTLMMYDIAGVQAEYGANYSTNSGDTVYTWSTTTGQMSINGVVQSTTAGNKIFMTIWDGGGNDTYSFANYTTSVTVDLQPGDWSTASTAQLANLGNGHFAAGNIANALLYQGNTASLIENAIGGSGNDTITGNSAANHLTGGHGNDHLDGLGGTDTAVYSGLQANYSEVLNSDGSWTVTDLRSGSPDGTDTLVNIEQLQFSDGTLVLNGSGGSGDHAPVGVTDSYSVAAGGTMTVTTGSGVLANDTDADHDTLSAVLVNGSAHGTVNLASDGSFTFTPTSGWTGSTSFTYMADDGSMDSAVTTVNLTVTPPANNHAPTAKSDSYTTNFNKTLTVGPSGVLSNDKDSDHNTMNAVLVGGATHGTVSLASDGSFVYTPNANYSGKDTFTYEANDGYANSKVTTVSLKVNADHAPSGKWDSYSMTGGTTLTVPASGVLANDSDKDGDHLTATLVSGPAHGTFSMAGDGSFVFTPDAGWSGSTSFTYKANDGFESSKSTKVTIKVAKASSTSHGTSPDNMPHSGGDWLASHDNVDINSILASFRQTEDHARSTFDALVADLLHHHNSSVELPDDMSAPVAYMPAVILHELTHHITSEFSLA